MKISNKCKEVKSNIFFFKALKDGEKKHIIEHIVSCPECMTLYERVNQINHVIEDHIEDKQLSHYTILQSYPNEKDYDGNKLSKKEVKKIDQHLKVCNACRSKFIEKQFLYSDLNTFLMELDIPDIIIKPFLKDERKTWERISQSIKTFIESIQFTKRFGYGMAVTLISFFVLIMFLLIERKKPSLEDLAKLDELNISISIRSGEADRLQKGILSFNENKYLEAIKQFQQFIENNKESNNATFAQYLLGLSYLKSANNNEGIDTTHLNNGISLLKTVLSSKNNQSLKENCLWYLGKAYIMKKDLIKATKYFEDVIDLDATKSQKSKIIVNQLKNFKIFM